MTYGRLRLNPYQRAIKWWNRRRVVFRPNGRRERERRLLQIFNSQLRPENGFIGDILRVRQRVLLPELD